MRSTPDNARDIPDSVRRHIYWADGLVWFILVTAICWTLYLGAAIFKFDLIEFLHGGKGEDQKLKQNVYLAFAVFGPIAAAIYGWVRVRQALHLARYGIEVPATIVGVGKLSAHGLVRVDYQYTVPGGIDGDLTHQKAMSCIKELALQYRDGTKQLILIVDPNKPKRAMEKDSVFPPDTPTS